MFELDNNSYDQYSIFHLDNIIEFFSRYCIEKILNFYKKATYNIHDIRRSSQIIPNFLQINVAFANINIIINRLNDFFIFIAYSINKSFPMSHNM